MPAIKSKCKPRYYPQQQCAPASLWWAPGQLLPPALQEVGPAGKGQTGTNGTPDTNRFERSRLAHRRARATSFAAASKQCRQIALSPRKLPARTLAPAHVIPAAPRLPLRPLLAARDSARSKRLTGMNWQKKKECLPLQPSTPTVACKQSMQPPAHTSRLPLNPGCGTCLPQELQRGHEGEQGLINRRKNACFCVPLTCYWCLQALHTPSRSVNPSRPSDPH